MSSAVVRGESGLTVVVPTHRRAGGLRALLESLARADEPPGGLRVVVVADGPQPYAAASVAEAVRRGLEVRLLEQPQSGPAVARNRGARQAGGSAVAFVDDDCRVEPGWPRALLARLAEQPGALVGGAVVNGHPAVPWSTASQLVVDGVVAWLAEHAPETAFFPSMNLAMDAATFGALGGFDEGFPLPAAEDRDLCERASRGGHALVSCPAARVLHDHRLDARGLWRQHVAYGRGCLHLQAARDRDGRPPPQLRPALYVDLARRAVAGRRPLVMTGVALTQLAYLVGLTCERTSRRGR